MQNHADDIVKSAGKCPDIITKKKHKMCNPSAPDSVADILPEIGSFENSLYEVLNCSSINAVAIWNIDEEHGFTLSYANPPFFTLIGNTGEESIGKPIRELVPPDICGILSRHFEECAQQRREVHFVAEKKELIYAVRVLPQIENGRIARIVNINIDISQYIHKRDRQRAQGSKQEPQDPLSGNLLKFESLIAKALREFMDCGIAGFDRCLSIFNSKLGEMMGADQSLICQRQTASLYVHKAYWSQDSQPQFTCPEHRNNIYSSRSSLPRINRLTVISDTGSNNTPCCQELKQMGIRAFLAVPICRDSHVYGLLCFTYLNEPHVWTTDEIGMTKIAADTIMSAYLRLRLEKSLSENIRVLTEYDESLQDLLEQKEMLAEVSRNFLWAGAHHFNECANRSLKNIGCLLDADGIRMIFRTADGGLEAFEWQEDGLPCRLGKEYGNLNATVLSAAEALSAPAAIDDTTAPTCMPELAKAGGEEGLRSLLIVPARHPDGVIGAFICYKAIGYKQWTHLDIASAKAFTEIFLNAYRLRQNGKTRSPDSA